MTREDLRHDFHNEQGINWKNSQGEPDIDYVMWLENKILAVKNNSLPPAEGAEEYIKRKHPQDWDEIPQWHIDEIKEFATLHAQRIADKMVSEMCKKCKYRGLPDSINEALNSGDGVYRP